ncbi:MAG TPA: 23S rRNA (uracil(1939)-C(5))-methyltransferase RlmD [Candidatus Ruminococcus gallistercoris]|nr:23S rRNA (uracil(1939)-C(5))-methyltransferase RlmD [Candidatus Ruminococcus gallistercoris]
MIRKNDIFEADITAMTAEGSGICRAEGMAVFVPGTAVGDRCAVRIVKVLRKYAFGRLEKLLAPSPDRIAPDCPVAAQCGGCVYRHIRYEAELRIKTQRVRDALERIGGLQDFQMEPILAAPDRCRYRNKCQLPIGLSKDGALQLGFYAVNSHRIVNTESCLLQPEAFDRAAAAFRRWYAVSGESVYDEASHSGVLRHLYMRRGEMSGEMMVCVVANGAALHEEALLVEMLREAVPEITGVLLNINREKTNVVLGKTCRTLWGKDTITDTLCGLAFEIAPHAFYQVNRTQAERLYGKAAEYAGLTGAETLLDLYCGTGTIGLSMAKNAKKLIGAEIVPAAVENARRNAERNAIQNAEFLCADAAEAARILFERGEKPDVIVINPPRKGCDSALIATIAAMRPKRVVYVSCDPATLARDLKLFGESGYKTETVTPADMFPGTAHVETVVLLSKLNTKQHVEVELNLDELDLTAAESKATYDEIKAYVLEKHGLKVSSLYISQVKRKCGLDVGQNYNLSKKENAKVPQCPPEKEAAIMEALKHFQMI